MHLVIKYLTFSGNRFYTEHLNISVREFYRIFLLIVEALLNLKILFSLKSKPLPFKLLTYFPMEVCHVEKVGT